MGQREFPPYGMLHDVDHRSLLDDRVTSAERKTRRLERLYHNTLEHAWNGREVLAELMERHGGIHVPEDKRESVGRLFTIILWGELAAWHVAADLARDLQDTDAKLAATGQVFDEARHFYVLRDYLVASGVPLPPLNPMTRRVLLKVLDTPSPLAKLSGMQLLVENLALSIFRKVSESRIEPVLSDLLPFIERDESRHVALGVLYLPKLLQQTTPWERAKLWGFSMECFLLTVAAGRRHDADFEALGIDHRGLALHSYKLHRRMRKEMAEAAGLGPDERLKGVYGLTSEQHMRIVDFLHPAEPQSISTRHRSALTTLDKTIEAAERVLI